MNMKKVNLLAAFVITILTSAGAWADKGGGLPTKPHTLRADVTLPVITLDQTGG